MLEEYKGDQINQRSNLDEANIRSDILVTNRIVELLGDVQGLDILELGCGNGKVARKLERLGAQVVAVDAIQEQIDIAKASSPATINYIHADFGATDFVSQIPAGPYDRIVSVMSLFYLSSTQVAQALTNAKELLKPEGLLVIGTASPYRGLKREGFDYFKEQEVSVVLPSRTAEPFTTTYIHLPPERLMAECIKNSFVLTKLLEPHATREELQTNPEILTDRDITVPDYLILEFKVAKR